MNFFTEVEQAILTLLQNADCAGEIRTWEAELREVLFTGEQLSKGFGARELPAVMVTTSQDPTRSAPFTTGEIRYQIPVQILVVVAATKREAARDEVLRLIRSMEAMLHQARRSDGLGLNTFIGDELLSSHVVVQDRPHQFAVGNITATVWKVVEL